VPIATGTLVLDHKEHSGDFIIDAPFRGSVTLALPFIARNGLLDAMRSSGQGLFETELRGVGGHIEKCSWTRLGFPLCWHYVQAPYRRL
jgi:hypothetical protein